MSNPYETAIHSQSALNKLKFLKRAEFIIKSVEDVLSLHRSRFNKTVKALAPRASRSTPAAETLAKVLSGITISQREELIDVIMREFTSIANYSYVQTTNMIKRILPTNYFEDMMGGLILAEAEESNNIRSETFANILARKTLDAIDTAIVDRQLLEPPSPEIVREVLLTPVAGIAWPERITAQSRLVEDPQLILNKIIDLTSSGVPFTDWEDELAPLLKGSGTSARRIARTESQRIANTISMIAYDQIDYVIQGFQINEILDDVTRPTHRARNGKIYFKDKSKFPNLESMPNLPDAPNCRGWPSPVMIDEEVVRTDAGNLAIKTPEGNLLDPGSIQGWFANQSDEFKMKIVGKNRFNIVAARVQRSPDWSDFVSPETGQLMKTSELIDETMEAMAIRTNEVIEQIFNFESIVAQASGAENVIGSPRAMFRYISTISKVQPTPKPFIFDYGTSAAEVIRATNTALTALSDFLGKGVTTEDIATLTGASDDAVVFLEQNDKLITMTAEHPFYSVRRVVDTSNRELKQILNDGTFFTVAGRRYAASMLARQAQRAQKLGFDAMNTYAAKEGGELGYSTWAKLGYGYDFPIIDGEKANFNFPFPFNLANNLRELLAIEGGEEYWRQNGFPFFGTFELQQNAESIRMLNQYLGKKADQGLTNEILKEAIEPRKLVFEQSDFADRDPSLQESFESWRLDYIKRMNLNSDGTLKTVDEDQNDKINLDETSGRIQS
jgi:SPP1 gp7 family putative phage head morphogenesis protein